MTVVSKLIVFLSLAAAFTGSFLLFKFFYWGGGIKDISEDYASFVRKVGIRLAFTGSLVMPLFLMIDLFDLPNNALSQAVFFYAVLAVILVFLGFIYNEPNTR